MSATKGKYSLTPEHQAMLGPWAEKWIKNAMSTEPASSSAEELRDAIEGLYRSANLQPPPRHRIVIAPSPFVVRWAGGIAAAIWHQRTAATYAATRDATYAATDAATRDATRDATYDATYAATDDATDDATYAATYAATDDATRDATYGATYAATDDATYAATRDATDAATEMWYMAPVPESAIALCSDRALAVSCAISSWRMWQGGNQWSAWAAYQSFFRHVAKLPIDFSK